MLVFSDGLELKQIMDRHGFTIAVAESLTTGNIQAAIGSVSGSSTFYEGGVTAYQLEHKVRMLGVDRNHAAEVNCVSQRVAIEMAKGVAEKFGTDFGIGTTGYAEPQPSTDLPIPYAYVAIWRRAPVTLAGGVIGQKRVTGGGLARVEMQRHVSAAVLALLMDYLRGV